MEEMEKYLVIAVIVSVIMPLISVVIYPSTDTVWNVFYERHANDVYYNGRLPEYDNLSYLGRPNTFVPAYFDFKAGFMRLLNLEPGTLSDTLYQVLGNIFLAAAVFALCSTLKFNARQSFIYWMIIVTNNFVLSWIIGHYMHLLGFALFVFALYYYNKQKEKVLPLSILVGVTGLLHSLYLVAFPFMAYVLGDRDWKRALKTTLPAVLLFMAFYMRTILTAGLPYEILPNTWGYLIRGNIEGFLMFTLLWSPLLLIGLHRSLSRMKDKVLAHAAIVSLMIFFFFSFRVNVFMLMILGVIAVRELKREIGYDRFWKTALFIGFANVIMLGTAHYGTWAFGQIGFLNEWYSDSMPFLSAVPGPVVSDPLFGHPIAYYTRHKVLADLYVEYADEKKYEAAMEFVQKGDLRPAACYGVKSALLKPDMKRAGMDIVFTNQYFSVATKAFQPAEYKEPEEEFTCPSQAPS